jgi:hypothetical protein
LSEELPTTAKQLDRDNADNYRARDCNPLSANGAEIIGEPALSRMQAALGQSARSTLLAQVGYRIDKCGTGHFDFGL